jgi:hypothetical protein
VKNFVIAAALLLLGGCSTARVIYENADVYLKWKAASYFDLRGEAADELDSRIDAFLDWHRAQALSKYAALTDDAARRFARGLSREDLVWGYDSAMAQARESVRAAAERIAPPLDRLTPAQIAHLERQFAEDNRRFARDNLRGGERERRKRRTERNVERLEDWVGRLSKGQVERVAQYSERAPLLEEMRERDHKRLQAELLAMLRAREARKRLPEAAANWDRGRDPAYVTALEAARREYFAMALDIERSLSSQQRSRALRKLRQWSEDFRILARAQ